MTVKERPILFSGEMVKAILSGQKTQTRRIVKRLDACNSHSDSPDEPNARFEPCLSGNRGCAVCGNGEDYYGNGVKCSHGKPSDQLWVRESFSRLE